MKMCRSAEMQVQRAADMVGDMFPFFFLPRPNKRQLHSEDAAHNNGGAA